MFLSIRKLEELFGTHHEKIKEAIDLAHLKAKSTKGINSYDSKEVFKILRDGYRDKKTGLNLTEEKAKTEIERRKSLELDNKKKEGTLMEVLNVNSIFDQITSMIKSSFRNMPSLITTKISHLSPEERSNSNIIKEICQKEVDHSLLRLSEFDIEKELISYRDHFMEEEDEKKDIKSDSKKVS